MPCEEPAHESLVHQVSNKEQCNHSCPGSLVLVAVQHHKNVTAAMSMVAAGVNQFEYKPALLRQATIGIATRLFGSA